MADELRIPAEIVDKFSAPLKSFRNELIGTAKQGADHTEGMVKGFAKVEGALQSTARTASTVLNPALGAIGVTGLGAGVAVSGIVSALSSLTGKLSGLGQLSRETGMAADQLRLFQAVAGKFGISADTSTSAAQVFARNMRDIRRGLGETMGFLQGQNPVVAQFALKLKGSKNNDEARKLTEDFLEQIPDAQDRKKFAQHMFGSEEFGRLGDRHLGSIAKLREGMQQKMGPLAPEAVESAERYERALGSLRTSMQKVGETIALELVQPAEKFTTWIDDIVSGKRKEGIDALRNGMREIGEELGKVPWKAAGESAKEMLLSTTALVKPVAESIREIAAALRSFNEGKYVEAFRHLDGGSGPLTRKLAPLPGDDKIERGEQVDALRGRIATAKEQGGLQADLLKDLEARGDKDGAKRLREAMEANTRHVKTLEDTLRRLLETGATAQKSSVEGDGPFPGARVQTAGLGGFTRLRGLNDGGTATRLPGLGNGGPGAFLGGRSFGGGRFNGLGGGAATGGADAPGGPPADRLPGMGGGAPRLPGMGNSDTAPPDAPGTFRPQRQLTDRDLDDETVRTIAGEARLGSAGGVDAVINNMFNRLGSKGWGPSRDLHDVARAPGQYEGYNARVTAAQAEHIRSRIRAIASGSVPDNTNGSNSFRASWYRGPWWHRHGKFGKDVGGNTFAFDPSIPNGPYAPYPNPKAAASGDGDYFPNGAPRVLRPNSMRDAPGVTMAESDRMRAGLADGEGWAARERARKDFETKMREGDERLTASAGRAGIVAAPKVENNGSVVVNVQKPGPDTRVSTSASGSLFRDVVMRRGQTMEKAGGS